MFLYVAEKKKAEGQSRRTFMLLTFTFSYESKLISIPSAVGVCCCSRSLFSVMGNCGSMPLIASCRTTGIIETAADVAGDTVPSRRADLRSAPTAAQSHTPL